ncbi:MAG: CDP-diacylglycerol--serine O-phosphatidyltransferase [Thermomicrobiales bacterium]
MRPTMRHGCEQLPNIVTLGSLLCGVTAIMLAGQRHFLIAPALICLAGVCDLLDGALARQFACHSRAGEELDSLADVIAFGVAPGLLVYERFFQPWPVLGWVVAGGYVLCGAWRLARFAATPQGLAFQGLPITMAGLSVAALLFYPEFWSPRLVALLTLALAALMVSRLRFPKLPVLLALLPRPARLLALAIMLTALLFSFSTVLLVLGLSYFVIAALENLGAWDAVADGPVGDAVARLRERF